MNALWDRLHNWLSTNAPAGYGNLRPGADIDAIETTERAIGLKFPDQVKDSYLVHDGQDDGPGIIGGEGWQLLPLHLVVEYWARWFQADPTYACFVPIAENEMSDCVLLDLDIEARDYGRLLVQRRDCIGPDPLAPTILVWFADFVDQLEDGVFAYSNDDGMVMYADELDID